MLRSGEGGNSAGILFSPGGPPPFWFNNLKNAGPAYKALKDNGPGNELGGGGGGGAKHQWAGRLADTLLQFSRDAAAAIFRSHAGTSPALPAQCRTLNVVKCCTP